MCPVNVTLLFFVENLAGLSHLHPFSESSESESRWSESSVQNERTERIMNESHRFY